jgi:hypothetical protein
LLTESLTSHKNQKLLVESDHSWNIWIQERSNRSAEAFDVKTTKHRWINKTLESKIHFSKPLGFDEAKNH